MKTNKIIIGGVVGLIVLFLLGWIIHGVILVDFMKGRMNPCALRPMEKMVWWSLVAGNFLWGLLLAILISWTNNTTASGGAKIGAVVGFLVSASSDLCSHALTTMLIGKKVVCVDVLAATITAAIAGAIIGWVMGMGKKEA